MTVIYSDESKINNIDSHEGDNKICENTMDMKDLQSIEENNTSNIGDEQNGGVAI